MVSVICVVCVMSEAYARRAERSKRYADTALLPEICTHADYRELHSKTEPWDPALRVICERHGLPFAELTHRRGEGSHIVYVQNGGAVVKLFGPLFPDDCWHERLVLAHVHGRLGVATPEVLFEGELEGWPYLVLSFVPGREIRQVWPQADRDQRVRLGAEIGALMARWHALPTTGLEALHVDWPEFIRGQVRSAAERQREKGLGPEWLDPISEYAAAFEAEALKLPCEVLLNADFCDDHVFVEDRRGNLCVVGLIDFGDAFLGRTDYDFVAPTLEIMLGDGPAQRALFSEYGLAVDDELPGALMAWTLLHRFGNLPWSLRQVGGPAECRSLPDLARRLWPF